MRCSMRHLLLSAVLISLIPSIAGCGRAAPDAGEEAVLIAKPWFFGHVESINMQKSVCGKLKSGCAFVSPGNSAIINLH
jgi:hypothetical protein